MHTTLRRLSYFGLCSLFLLYSTTHLAQAQTDLSSIDKLEHNDLLSQSYLEAKDTVLVADSLLQDSLQEQAQSYKLGKSILRRTLTTSLPMVALALPYTLSNKYIRDARNNLYPTFRHHYDDYLQFAPLAAQLGMRSFGLKGYSENPYQMLTSDALSMSIMLGTVYSLKQVINVRRPDNSASNSFPSGHTAMAFMSATALSLEYGDRYPWITPVAYLSASSVGIGRILNNRHWVGDVTVGATIGIVSAELGYWLSDLIFKRPARKWRDEFYLKDIDLRLTLPWSKGINPNTGFDAVGMGLGMRWLYNPKHKFLLLGEAQLEGKRFDKNTDYETFIHNYIVRLAWGKKITLIPSVSSVDFAGGLGWGAQEAFPFVRVSPRLRLSRRLSWRIDASYEYRTKEYTVYRPEIGDFKYSAPNWRLGSAFEIRL